MRLDPNKPVLIDGVIYADWADSVIGRPLAYEASPRGSYVRVCIANGYDLAQAAKNLQGDPDARAWPHP